MGSSLNLRKYFEAFPLKNIFFSEDGQRAFFIEELATGERRLKGLDSHTETNDTVLKIANAEVLSP